MSFVLMRVVVNFVVHAASISKLKGNNLSLAFILRFNWECFNYSPHQKVKLQGSNKSFDSWKGMNGGDAEFINDEKKATFWSYDICQEPKIHKFAKQFE